MTRGTTPTNVFNTDTDLTDATVYVTYSQSGRTVIEKTGGGVEVEPNRVTVRLSQAETLRLDPAYRVRMQIRYVMPDGTAGASNIMAAGVGEILKEGEIGYVQGDV